MARKDDLDIDGLDDLDLEDLGFAEPKAKTKTAKTPPARRSIPGKPQRDTRPQAYKDTQAYRDLMTSHGKIYHCYFVGIGVYAARLLRTVPPEQWALVKAWKETENPETTAKMAQEIVKIIEDVNLTDVVTCPPRSPRRAGKYYPAAALAQAVAEHFHLTFQEVFKPSKREGRGFGYGFRTIDQMRAELVEDGMTGKHVLLIDDIATTGLTMKRCIKVLRDQRNHVHAYLWARH